MYYLNQLLPGQSGKYKGCENPDITTRLMALGLMEGCLVEMVRTSPLGDTYYVKAGNSRLALRSTEAAAVRIESAKDE